MLEVVPHEAVLRLGHAVARLVERPQPFDDLRGREPGLDGQGCAPTPRLAPPLQEVPLDASQELQREVGREQQAGYTRVDALESRGLLGTLLRSEPFPPAQQPIDLLEAGVEVLADVGRGAAIGLGEPPGRPSGRTRLVPQPYDLPGGARDPIEGLAIGMGGGLVLLGEEPLLLAREDGKVADVGQVGGEGALLSSSLLPQRIRPIVGVHGLGLPGTMGRRVGSCPPWEEPAHPMGAGSGPTASSAESGGARRGAG
jgi:hypothetical protein